jgi:hypothetical protein
MGVELNDPTDDATVGDNLVPVGVRCWLQEQFGHRTMRHGGDWAKGYR